MKDNKTINIETRAFKLTIYWNSKLISTQFTILLGLLLIILFGTNSRITSLCVCVLVIDLLSIIFSLTYPVHKTVNDEKQQEKSQLDISTEKVSKNKTKTKKTVIKNTTSVINNKVGVPKSLVTTEDVEVQTSDQNLDAIDESLEDMFSLSDMSIEEMEKLFGE